MSYNFYVNFLIFIKFSCMYISKYEHSHVRILSSFIIIIIIIIIIIL